MQMFLNKELCHIIFKSGERFFLRRASKNILKNRRKVLKVTAKLDWIGPVENIIKYEKRTKNV